MAKPQRASLKGSGLQASGKQNAQQDSQQPVQQDAQQNTPQAARGLQSFATLSDQQQADMVNKAKTAKAVPGFPDTFYQKFVMANGLDAKPKLVTDAQMDAMPGKDFYRGINAKTQDAADQIVMNTLMHDYTFFSDSGGSALGRGIYAMQDLNDDVRLYGSSGGVNNIMRMKLDSDAKTISYSNARTLYERELASGSRLGKSLKGIYEKDAISIVAAAKGYSAITRTSFSNSSNEWGNILSRDKLSISMQYHRVTPNDIKKAQRGTLTWNTMER